MTAEMVVSPAILEGVHARLEPLRKAHLAELAQVGLDEELWRWIPTPVRTREEGVFRNHMVTASGRIRHTVYFSIIDSEWPAVKARLEAKLNTHRR